ncbi:AT-rich interactive domain-containing protein 2-like isoform X2 [Dysidea avara]|uniref:AT-rich interactive domain-containing protein 2-like isoform X2 n=1 Tax=Dysidea avara TaxID=196820 RepID=UPI0033213FA2
MACTTACTQQSGNSPEETEFLSRLYKFHEHNGTPIKKVPIVGGEAVDMFTLYNKVVEMGGFTKITRDKQWNEIAQHFYKKYDVMNAGYLLKQHYIRFLMKYELSMKDSISPRPMKSAKTFDDSRPRVISPSFKIPSASLGRTPVPLNNRTPSAAVYSSVAEPTASINSDEYNISHGVSFNYDLGVTAKTSHYKLVLSLKSGLPNELDFVFNALTILSSDEYDPLILSAAPSLLDLMLAQVGIYDECDERISALCKTWQENNTEVDYHKFWCSCVPNNVWCALVATKYQCESTGPQELFHIFCGIGESTIEAYRVGQVATIIRNLSFEKDNVATLGENKLLLSFVVLCMNCVLPSIMSVGYEIAVKIASVLRLTKAAENVASHLFVHAVVSAVTSGDRLQTIRGVEVLGELAWCVDNADLLADLPQNVYDTIIMHTLLPDVEMLFCCLETLYSLSSLDQEVTDRIVNTPSSINLLIQFLTFTDESLNQKARKIDVFVQQPVKQTLHPSNRSAERLGSTVSIQPVNSGTIYLSEQSARTSDELLTMPAAVTGSASFVSKWLKFYYEEARGGMISRTELLQDFQHYCTKIGCASDYTLMQLLRCVKMVFPTSYTRRIFDSNDAPQYVIGGLRKKFKSLWAFPPCSRSLSSTTSRLKFNVVPSDSKQLPFSYKPMGRSFNISDSEEVLQSHDIGVRSTNFNFPTSQHNKIKVSERHTTKELTPCMYSDKVKENLSSSSDGFCQRRSIFTNVPNNFEGLKSNSSSVLHKMTSAHNFAVNSTQVLRPFPVDSHGLCYTSLNSQNYKTVSINHRNVERLSTSEPVSDSISLPGKLMSIMEQKLATTNRPNTSQCDNHCITTFYKDVKSIKAPDEMNVSYTRNQKHLEESDSSKIYCQWEDCKGELKRYEKNLSVISLSGVDCAGIVAKCLFFLP